MCTYRRYIRCILIICGIVIFCANYGLAAGEPSEYLKYQEPPPPASSWFTASGYVFSLLLTFLLVLGLAYFTSRFLGQKMNGSAGFNNQGTIHSTLVLGPNRAVYVVETAGKFMVLGVTEQSISLLREITDPEDIEQLKARAALAVPSEQFADVFQRQLLALKQINKKFPAVFGLDTQEINEKEHENVRGRGK
ncbi:FliO/MopB family protein [Sporomusa termitida]|uniref:Flagellar biosynthetic protein FliO n=1 Tax=Sporomusa termitida TaxID=2377 RepID=A0A517DT18_9FIRM|nr:flagellar biosynthetic protein FliO [Sporomusa termitida]QDR80503.1 flagellar biosynthetic protein FliO [Sporomusa termitida]